MKGVYLVFVGRGQSWECGCDRFGVTLYTIGKEVAFGPRWNVVCMLLAI